jgi:hypothetical protein
MRRFAKSIYVPHHQLKIRKDENIEREVAGLCDRGGTERDGRAISGGKTTFLQKWPSSEKDIGNRDIKISESIDLSAHQLDIV